jgi:hypothetical protein
MHRDEPLRRTRHRAPVVNKPSHAHSFFPEALAWRTIRGRKAAMTRTVVHPNRAHVVSRWETESRRGQSDCRELRQDNCTHHGP